MYVRERTIGALDERPCCALRQRLAQPELCERNLRPTPQRPSKPAPSNASEPGSGTLLGALVLKRADPEPLTYVSPLQGLPLTVEETAFVPHAMLSSDVKFTAA